MQAPRPERAPARRALGQLLDDPELARAASGDPRGYARERGLELPQNMDLTLSSHNGPDRTAHRLPRRSCAVPAPVEQRRLQPSLRRAGDHPPRPPGLMFIHRHACTERPHCRSAGVRMAVCAVGGSSAAGGGFPVRWCRGQGGRPRGARSMARYAPSRPWAMNPACSQNWRAVLSCRTWHLTGRWPASA